MIKKLIPDPWEFKPSANNLRILDIRSVDELAAHEDAWAELLLQSPAASPMLSYPQISAFFETQLAPGATWLCLFAYEGEQLIGILPLIAARSFRAVGFSVVCYKTPYDDLHTGGVDCLTLHRREEIIESFVAYLSHIPRTWPLIRIREIPEHSPSIVHMSRPGSKLRAVKRISARENYIPISKDYAAYHGGLSSNFRRQLKRGGRKLEELEDVRFHCREEARAPAENMRRFEGVEDAGWKGSESTSLRAMPQNSKLYAIAAERFRKYGWMEWNFLEIAERTIGAHYAVRINRTLFLLKIAYDEEFSAYSPGNLLLEKAIESACNAGDLDEINCVADCAWHKNWSMESRLLYDLIILPKIPVISMLLSRLLNSENPLLVKALQRLTSKNNPSKA